ncbi:MAG TPA: hypothetical protein VHV51_20740 [Polyangiaceae bacterium]|jgi:hypothetical protein|nr:hypothetical protein [Polyangiaceae bacterium]
MKPKWSALFACCLLFAACSRDQSNGLERCAAVDAGTPVDPLLLAFLSRARAAHHLADEHEAAGDLNAAIAPLVELVAGPLPHTGNELAPEVNEVLADTRARLADLRSRMGTYDLAFADAEAGLEHATEPNYFRGHLLETEGLVEERRAKSLEKSDAGAAARARAHAIELLEQAMSVQARVIDKSGAPSSPAAVPASSASARSVNSAR